MSESETERERFECGVAPTLDCNIVVAPDSHFGVKEWRVHLNGGMVGVGRTRHEALTLAMDVMGRAYTILTVKRTA